LYKIKDKSFSCIYNSGFARIISDNLKKVVIRKQEAEECDATNVERSDKAGYIIKKRRPYGVGAVTQ